MEGRKFSSSRDLTIYVDDFLTRYDPDALRYYPDQGVGRPRRQEGLRLVRRGDRLPLSEHRVGESDQPSSRHYYFINKNNIIFHTVI